MINLSSFCSAVVHEHHMVTLLPAGGGAKGRLGGSSKGVASGVPVPNGEVGKGAEVGVVLGGKVDIEEGTGGAVPDFGVSNGVPVTPGPGYCSVAVSPGPGYCEDSVASGPGNCEVSVTSGPG